MIRAMLILGGAMFLVASGALAQGTSATTAAQPLSEYAQAK